jgi:hypothetical protein
MTVIDARMSVWLKHLADTEKLRTTLFGEEPVDVPIESARRAKEFCLHRRHPMQLDANKRRVFCSGCNTELDPYDALDLLCSAGDRWRRLVKESKRLTGEIEQLKAEEKRVKARLRRARKSLAKHEPNG